MRNVILQGGRRNTKALETRALMGESRYKTPRYFYVWSCVFEHRRQGLASQQPNLANREIDACLRCPPWRDKCSIQYTIVYYMETTRQYDWTCHARCERKLNLQLISGSTPHVNGHTISLWHAIYMPTVIYLEVVVVVVTTTTNITS